MGTWISLNLKPVIFSRILTAPSLRIQCSNLLGQVEKQVIAAEMSRLLLWSC